MLKAVEGLKSENGLVILAFEKIKEYSKLLREESN